ncbi:MAG: IMPACT family protein [Fusobacteriaceae bacterium]
MKTIKKETCIEFEEKKSKFIGYIKPIKTKKEAEIYIKEIKEKHKDASHNCSVYKVFEKGQEYFKADDDGEPSGTAGKPMGDILVYMEVENLVVVATRYFGGIKLGAGGLVRNYAKTAKLAVQEAGVEEYLEINKYILDFSYDKNSDVDNYLKINNIDILEKNYSERVTYLVELSKEQCLNIKLMPNILVVEV